MSSRINYIVIKDGKQTIYYNKWGAGRMTADLYRGQEAFLGYVKEFPVESWLMPHLLLEGLVIIDPDNKRLGFWSWEFESETSVIRRYLSLLEKIWAGWQIIHLANQMYDSEALLNINYLSEQTPQEFITCNEQEVIDDTGIDDYPAVLYLIRQHGKLFVAELANIMLESIICYGETILPLLTSKTRMLIPAEGEVRAQHTIFIDADNKKLIINASIVGLWEAMAHKWPGYTLKMGNIGYLAMLEEAHLPTYGLVMPPERIQTRIEQMIRL
jgi:hypothetical protein